MYSYKCAEAGCNFTAQDELQSQVRRQGRSHQEHTHGQNPPDPETVDARITRS